MLAITSNKHFYKLILYFMSYILLICQENNIDI